MKNFPFKKLQTFERFSSLKDENSQVLKNNYNKQEHYYTSNNIYKKPQDSWYTQLASSNDHINTVQTSGETKTNSNPKEPILDDRKTWNHYRRYRERRDLYEQIISFANK